MRKRGKGVLVRLVATSSTSSTRQAASGGVAASFGGDRHSPGGSGQLRPVGRATSKQPGGGPGAKLRGTGRQKKGEKKGKKGEEEEDAALNCRHGNR